MMFMWVWSFLFSCSSEYTTIVGTMSRISEFVALEDSKRELRIYHNRLGCEDLVAFTEEYNEYPTEEEAIQRCLPWVNRSTGEVHLGFSVYGNFHEPLSLTEENIEVTHNNRQVLNSEPESEVVLIPHFPVSVGQLFIVVIDGSGSMYSIKDGEIESGFQKVKNALRLNGVKRAFLRNVNSDATNGVVFFRFKDRGLEPIGPKNKVTIVETVEEYDEVLNKYLINPKQSGYTHLYDAVEQSTIDILQKSYRFSGQKNLNPITNWLATKDDAAPVVIILTDGFNNTSAREVCRDNVKPFESLYNELLSVRDEEDSDYYRPSIFTVGLGRSIRTGYRLKTIPSSPPSGKELCAKFQNETINANLENKGIDNVSLEWIAKVGGGRSFVTNRSALLGRAFQQVATLKYHWFELRYKVNPQLLRQSFFSGIKLNVQTAEASKIHIQPHGWLDAPTGTESDVTCDADGKECTTWTKPTSYLHVLTILLPLMGVLLFLSILNAGLYNIRRVLTGRLRRPPPHN